MSQVQSGRGCLEVTRMVLSDLRWKPKQATTSTCHLPPLACDVFGESSNNELMIGACTGARGCFRGIAVDNVCSWRNCTGSYELDASSLSCPQPKPKLSSPLNVTIPDQSMRHVKLRRIHLSTSGFLSSTLLRQFRATPPALPRQTKKDRAWPEIQVRAHACKSS